MPDCPLSEEVRNDWRIWRQEMRDITNTATFPLEYTFQLPNPPATGRPATWDNWDLSKNGRPWGDGSVEAKESTLPNGVITNG